MKDFRSFQLNSGIRVNYFHLYKLYKLIIIKSERLKENVHMIFLDYKCPVSAYISVYLSQFWGL